MVLEQYIANEYLRALILFILGIFILRLALTIIQRALLKITSRTSTDIDDAIIKRSSRPLTILAFLISLRMAINEITFTETLGPIVYNTIYSAIIIVIGYLLYIIIDILLLQLWKRFTERTETEIDDTIIHLAHSALRAAFIIIIILYVLNVWGVEIGPLLAGLGIAGLAVALALQPTLSNIFSGVALILDQTLKVGDIVKIESGEMGEVHKIGLRATSIKTFDNEMLIIPNSTLANTRVQNFFQPDLSIRVNVNFGVEYGVDPEYIKKLAIEEVEKIKFIDKEEEIRVLFLSMGDNALNFKVMFWVDNISKKWPAHQEAITRIYRRLYKEKIGIPFPQRTVWLREEGKAKSSNPDDIKFKKTQNKFYSNFGHEYKEEKETKPKKQTKKEQKRLFSFDKLKSRFKKKK